MSEYLGWTERKPAFGSKPAVERENYAAGPVTHSYESYVKNIFHPANRLKGDKSQLHADRGIPASAMVRMERAFGRAALDESYDPYAGDTLGLMKTPLEQLYSDIGMKSSENALYRQFPVYEPKQSSEYFAIRHQKPEERHYDEGYRGSYSSYRDREDEEYNKNNKKTLIDYKDFDSPGERSYAYDGFMYSPLSPYLYQSHPYVKSQDSRIVGSNFVQVTSRPKDRFLEKVEATLKEVRDMPRYC